MLCVFAKNCRINELLCVPMTAATSHMLYVIAASMAKRLRAKDVPLKTIPYIL